MDNQKLVSHSSKSAGLAVVLALFFGPIGMLYASFGSAAIMFFVNIVVGIFTAGFGLLLTIPIGAIWAYSIVQQQNQGRY